MFPFRRFTGDGRAELAVYRGGVWWSLDLSNNQVNAIQFGILTIARCGRYDGTDELTKRFIETVFGICTSRLDLRQCNLVCFGPADSWRF